MNFHDPDREKIEKIINTEWDMFQQVDNIGGRADCQDDFETSYIMRRSQYDNWTTEMVDAYSDFAARSQEEGRNLVSEKYARMMAYTDLHYFNKHLRDKLPAVPAKNFRLINRIVERLICWEEEMARRYPEYEFERHTGYPTRRHYELLRKYGPCPIHRRTFLRKL